MAMQIITGYTGTEHIQPRDDAAFSRGIFGDGDFVLNTGSQFAATIVSTNEVKIADGDLIMQGRYSRIDSNSFESVIIENGTAGMMRNDLICARWEKNTTTNIESCTLVVKKGTAATTATDPTYATGNIDDDEIREMPLYRVRLNGINLEGIDKLFNVADSIVGLERVMNQFSTNMTNQFNDFINKVPEFLYSGQANAINETTRKKILKFSAILLRVNWSADANYPCWAGYVLNKGDASGYGFSDLYSATYSGIDYFELSASDGNGNKYAMIFYFLSLYINSSGSSLVRNGMGMKKVAPYFDSFENNRSDYDIEIYGIK